MSLVTSAVYPVLDGIPTLEGTLPPRDDASRYTLRHQGGNWALQSQRAGSSSTWSTPLAAHGAGADAPDRVARAVAVRVLRELHVEISGWLPEPAPSDGQTPEARAITAGRRASRAVRRP